MVWLFIFYFQKCDYSVGVLMQKEQCSFALICIVESNFMPLTSGANL